MKEFSNSNLSPHASGSQFGPSSINKFTFSSNIQAITPKLNISNFSFWRYQLLLVVRAHNLESHLLGLSAYPAPFIQIRTLVTAEETIVTKQTNLDYIVRLKIDKQLVSWLVLSISESMFSVISKCKVANEIWSTLENELILDSKS